MTYLYGVVENCFNKFYTFRGYAKLKDIVRYSDAYGGYQHNLNDEYTNAITQYFCDRITVFSPEVILEYSVEDWWNKKLNPSFCGEDWYGDGGVSPIDYLVNNNSVSDHTRVVLKDSFGVQVAKMATNLSGRINLAKIMLPDDLLFRPFKRIDGSHRLEDMSLVGDNKAEYKIPFCIVFLNAVSFEKQTKQIPLTPEESFQAIIKNEKLFLDDELKTGSSFEFEYYLTRKLSLY